MDYDLIASAELPPFREHPLYTQGMAQLSAGEWREAFKSFQLLQRIYPNEAEAEERLAAAQMRAALAGVEPRHSSRVARRPSFRRLFVATLAAIVAAIAIYIIYELWINPVIVQQLRLRQITSLRHEADEAIVAGDFAQARQSLEQLRAIMPEDPEAIAELQRVEQVERVSALYDEAKALIGAGNWDQAAAVLSQLETLDEDYRDLQQLLQVTQKSRELDRQFEAARETFAQGDWAGAISKYEALRQADLTFRFEEVQAQLYETHLKYGQALIQEGAADPNQVTLAISQFSQALKLRPIDDDALQNRRLAEIYLSALESVDQDETIDLLQKIYDEEPGYAGQALAQLLYTTLLGRADSLLSIGDEAGATADYQTAAQLQVEDTSEAQEKLTELSSQSTSTPE